MGCFFVDGGDGRNLQRSETERRIEERGARRNGKLILNSRVLVIIREPQQPLLNYRSHRRDWMRLGHCNASLIIYRLYYYSNNCVVGVSVLLPSPFYFLVTKRTLFVLHLAKAVPIKSDEFWLLPSASATVL